MSRVVVYVVGRARHLVMAAVPQALAQQTSIQPLVTIEGGITRFVAAPLVPQDLYLRVAQIRVTRVKQVNMYLDPHAPRAEVESTIIEMDKPHHPHV